jgi:type VI secretion system protein ImpB
MPLVKVIRKGVTPHVRTVPTSTAAVTLPMTTDRIGREITSENEEPVKVESLQDAFDKFRPGLNFRCYAGPNETEFRIDCQFRTIKDFEPENLQKRQEIKTDDGEIAYLRNDLAALKNKIDVLYRIKNRWQVPAVRRAWANHERRREIIESLNKLRVEMERLAEAGED